MKYHIRELLDHYPMQQLLDAYCQSVGISASIMDLKGEVLIEANWQPICTGFHRVNQATKQFCIENDAILAGKLKTGEQCTICSCRNGLSYAAAPLDIDGEHVANVIIGQFLLRAPDREFFRNQAARYGFDEARFLAALDQVPVISDKKLHTILNFLVSETELIGAAWLDRVNLQLVAREREEEAVRRRILVDGSRDGIVVVDQDGKIFEANRKFGEMLGYDQAELQDLHLWDWDAQWSRESLLKMVREVDETGDNFETLHRRKDGSLMEVEISTNASVCSGQKLIFCVCRDITERKRAERNLLASEQRYHNLFEEMVSGFALMEIVYDDDGTPLDYLTLEVNRAFEKILEASRDQVVGRLAYADNPKLDSHWLEIFSQVAISGEPCRYERFASNVGKWFGGVAYPAVDGKVAVTFVDITQQKQAAIALQESSERFRSIIDNTEAGYFFIDTEGIIRDVNQAWANMYKYSSVDEIIGHHFTEVQQLDDIELAKDFVAGIMRGDSKYMSGEFSRQCKDGSIGYHTFTANPVMRQGEVVGIEGFIIDSTESKIIKESLRKSEEEYRTLIENTTDIIMRFDRAGRHIYVSPSIKSELDMAPDLFIGKTHKELGFPEDICQLCEDAINRVFKSGKMYETEFSVDGKEGEVTYNWRVIPEFDDDGNVKTAMSTARNVTRRKQVELTLKESEKRFHSLFYAMEEGVALHQMIYDKRGKAVDYIVLDVNLSYESITGLKKKQVVGKKASNIYDTSEPPYMDIYGNVAATGKATSFETYFQPMEKHFNISVFSPAKGQFATVFFDVTKHRQLEQEQARAAKLESIGLLAGGIAHDFNNILTAIVGNISLAKMISMREGSETEDVLAEAENAVMRAKDLTMQLLTFAKGGEPVRKTTSLADLICETTKFTLMGSNVRCRHYLAKDLKACEIDQGQISQVINNLLINGVQAMPLGGTISVRAENYTQSRNSGLGLKKGEYVKLTIKDQGIGIPEQNLAKVFDPYFTTKEKGSGLGLATSYSIIKRHNGLIKVESKLDVGTTFQIYLPASKKSTSRITSKRKSSGKARGRVLLMDDDQQVSNTISKMLQLLGHEVKTAPHGRAAIHIYKQAIELGQRFDVVILDLTIPGGMGGRETIAKLLELDPDVKAIVSSGYSNDPVVANYRDYGFTTVVSKPYLLEELREALESVMKN